MEIIYRLSQFYRRLGERVMPVKSWIWFSRAVALTFLVYWLHLKHGLNDWLGTSGFHLSSPIDAFEPLPFYLPELLWGIVLIGIFMLFFQRTIVWGSLLAGGGFFYATFCDPASSGALNMNFLFALAIIFWSTCLSRGENNTISAWPAYLIRIYLIIVYFGSGWRKVIYGNWLDDPHALLHCMSGYYVTDLTRGLYFILPPIIWTIVQYSAVVFELGAPLLLLYPSLKRLGVIWGCFLHLGIALLMKDLFYFSLQMLTFYIPVLIPKAYFSVNSKSDHQPGI